MTAGPDIFRQFNYAVVTEKESINFLCMKKIYTNSKAWPWRRSFLFYLPGSRNYVQIQNMQIGLCQKMFIFFYSDHCRCSKLFYTWVTILRKKPVCACASKHIQAKGTILFLFNSWCWVFPTQNCERVKNKNLVLSNELIKVELPPWKI